MCETAKERYKKTLTIFKASLRRGRPTKLSEVCRDNKVYYRCMLKWLFQTGRTIADIRKCGDAYEHYMVDIVAVQSQGNSVGIVRF